MATIIQVTKSANNPIDTILGATGKGGDPPTVVADLASVEASDIVLVGPDDIGEPLDLDILIGLLDAGSVVVFSHSNPGRTVYPVPEETREEYEVHQAAYLAKLASDFGMVGFDDGFAYEFFSHVTIVTPNVYTELTEFDVQPTHTTGIRLSSDTVILINNPLVTAGPTNYYLAEYTRPAGGTVIHWNAGHCNYGHLLIDGFTDDERAMVNNLFGFAV